MRMSIMKKIRQKFRRASSPSFRHTTLPLPSSLTHSIRFVDVYALTKKERQFFMIFHRAKFNGTNFHKHDTTMKQISIESIIE